MFLFDMFVIASAFPEETKHMFSFLRPMNREIWVLLAISICVASIAAFQISSTERKVNFQELPNWQRLDKSFWNTFGIFIGENMALAKSIAKAPNTYALRLQKTSLKSTNASY